MASNPIGEFISSLMASKNKGEEETLTHLSSVADGAQWRLEDDMPAHRNKGFHQHHQRTAPKGFPEVPRQYIVTTHSKEQDYATYAANSYSSCIAITEMIKNRSF